MSISVKNSGGDWVQCAGQGRAEYGASTMRSGSVTTPVIAGNSYATVEVTFSTSMPDADYIAVLSARNANWTKACYTVTTKTASGFVIACSNTTSAEMPAQTIDYTAFKLYTDTTYNKILESLPVVDSVTDGDMHAVSSNAVCDEIYSRGHTFVIGANDSSPFAIGENHGGIIIAMQSNNAKHIMAFEIGWCGEIVTYNLASDNMISVSYSNEILSVSNITSIVCLATVIVF